MPKREITLTLPQLHNGQQIVKNEAGRFNVLDCGRRFGKTTLGIDLAVSPDVLCYPVGWFSPTYKMLLEVWREAVRIVVPITAKANEQNRRIELITGGLLEFWSLDNQDSARGRKYRRIIIDEAAMIKNLMDAWQFVLRPTLMDYSGDAFFMSTPRGRNGFYQMFAWGQDPLFTEWRSWQMPTSTNPHIKSSEIEAMRITYPERVYRQEVLAEFLEDAGGVFRRVADAATANVEPVQLSHQYVIGVDWGKHQDFTVLIVMDAVTRCVVEMERFNQIDYTVQSQRLIALCERYAPSAVIVERNSIGEPLIEQLQRSGLPVQAFQTTNATKTAIIDALSLAFERGEIGILNDATLINELQAYEMERLPSGLLRYSAPEGMHDDCVMALALAWYGLGRPAPSDLVAFVGEDDGELGNEELNDLFG